jgi:hypothetical protein
MAPRSQFPARDFRLCYLRSEGEGVLIGTYFVSPFNECVTVSGRVLLLTYRASNTISGPYTHNSAAPRGKRQ